MTTIAPAGQLLARHASAAGRPVTPVQPRSAPALEAVWARDEADVRQAQQLRWSVFVEEMATRALAAAV
jgi:putative hemolysin